MDAAVESRRNPVSKHQIQPEYGDEQADGGRDGRTTVSRDQILGRERGQGNIHFPCAANNEQDWQPYTVDPYSAISDIIHTCAYEIQVALIKITNELRTTAA